MAHITILGLGPGDPGLLTMAAWRVLQEATDIWVRTRAHPTVDAFPAGLNIHSFDHLYDVAEDFAVVYRQIADRVIALARQRGGLGVLYAVPGDASIGEATTRLIRDQAASEGVSVQVVPGVSFLEPTCLALGIDPLDQDGLQLLDAMVVATSHAPPMDTSRPALLAQCYSRSLASDVKLTLMQGLAPDHPVTVIQAAGTPAQRLWSGLLFELDRLPQFDHLTTVYVPAAGPWASYGRLQEIVARLRAPDGCPWDREQTLSSLRRDVIEEVFELIEALDADDDDKLQEELGDTALLIAMLSQIAGEEERFRWPAVMTQIGEKLIRRHPHVFGEVQVRDSQEVLANWAAIKAQERQLANGGQEESPLASVPRSLPALALARKYQSRLERAGIEPQLPDDNPVGLALWELVAQARAEGADAETALRELCRHVARALDGSPVG